MRKFREITEKAGDTAVFTFGRFNPPTIGHEKLVNAVAAQQKKNAGSKMYVYPSHSNDPKKNPLNHSKKTAYMRKMFKKYSRNIITAKARTAIEVAVELHNKGHKAIVMVVGSDRVAEFERLLNEYNGVEGRHGYYGFDNIEVVSAGERDPDAEGVEGMSASKMRDAAEKGDFDSFKTGIPATLSDADKKKMYFDVRKGMGMREERDMGDMNNYEEMRDAYLTGKIWNVGEIVEANGLRGEVVRKGTNYLSFMTEDGKVHKAWLHDIGLEEAKWRVEFKSPLGPKDSFTDTITAKNKQQAIDKAHEMMKGHSKDGKFTVRKEELELDESPFASGPLADLISKIDTITHPKRYRSAMKKYASLMAKDRAKRMTPSALASNAAREHGLDGKTLINYINSLVSKGKLPQRLKAEFATEATSPLGRLQKFDKSRTAAGKKPIFKDKGDNKFVRMKKKGQMTIMNVPSNEVDKYKKKGYVSMEQLSFKDFVNQIQEVKQDTDIEDKKGTQPAKYYAKDAEGDKMSVATKKKRDAHFKAKKTGPAPGDAGAETKPSVHTKKYKQMFGERELTDTELKRREDIAKDLPDDDFKKRYGKDWKSVKIATATKMAKAESLIIIVSKLEKLNESGHTDVSSMKTKVEIAMNALEKMRGELGKLSDEDDLPTWWTNKVATAVSRLDDMSDYLDTQVEGFKLNEKIDGLVKKSEKSGISYSILKKVYDRGMAAWKTGHRPGTTPQQWAFARVNSFITKGSGTWGKADKDLAKQVEMVEALDDLKYPKTKETPVKNISGNLDEINVSVPPKNDSEETRNELNTVKKLSEARSAKDEKSVKDHDQDVTFAVEKYMNKNGLDYNKEDMKKIVEIGESVSRHFKNNFQRPRPWQIAENIKLNVMSFPSDSMETPSYPSGHSLQSRLVAEVYAKKYPQHKEGLIAAANECGMGRIQAGWHYPSDHKSGVSIAKQVAPMVEVDLGEACWDTHKQVGLKKKGGKMVPNCVPKNEDLNEWGEVEEAAEYQGRKVTLNKPFYTPDGPKKSAVYVTGPKGNVVIVRFGDPNMEIKRDNPERRKSFRARHNCDNPGPKWKAKYWSCKAW